MSRSRARSSWTSRRGCLGAFGGAFSSSPGASSGYSGGYEICRINVGCSVSSTSFSGVSSAIDIRYEVSDRSKHCY